MKSQDYQEIIELVPVGIIKNAIKSPSLAAGKDGLSQTERMDRWRTRELEIQQSVSELIIHPEWVELLDGIDSFSHILVLYWPHLLDPQQRNLKKVHPMGRRDVPLQGIFATCSPARPNPVLVSAVPLKARNGNVVEVTGLEAVDGSPIIDLKPYSRHYLQVSNLKPADWMDKLHNEMKL